MKMAVTFANTDEKIPVGFAESGQLHAVGVGEVTVIHGKDGYTPIKGVDYFTAEDVAEIVAAVKASMITETWTFTLEDGSTVAKQVLVDA